MKLRNNYEVGDRILILHANIKNQLRKNDIGKIGTILDKRCSFCIVHLDGDDRDKNYNYGTFGKIIKLFFCTEDKSVDFNNTDDLFEYIKNTYNTIPIIKEVKYDKNTKFWNGIVTNEKSDYVGSLSIQIDNKLNNKFPENDKTRN